MVALGPRLVGTRICEAFALPGPGFHSAEPACFLAGGQGLLSPGRHGALDSMRTSLHLNLVAILPEARGPRSTAPAPASPS